MYKPLQQRNRVFCNEVKDRLKNKISRNCKNTILINSNAVVDVAPQTAQTARLMKFVFGLVSFIERADYEGFREYVEQSYKDTLICKSMRTVYLDMNKRKFNETVCRTFFSQEDYYTIYIKNGSGFEINPKSTKKYGDGVYWHLTLHEFVRSGRKTRSQKDRIILRYISKLCSGTEEEFIQRMNINPLDQIAYDYLLFTEYAHINGLYLSFHKSLIERDMVNLLRGTRDQKLYIMSKVKHRLNVQTTFNTQTKKLDAYYPVDKHAVDLFRNRLSELPPNTISIIEESLVSEKNRVQELNKLQVQISDIKYYLRKYNFLKVGGETKWVKDKIVRALTKRVNYMNSLLRYMQNKQVANSTTIKDFVCNIHNLIVRDIEQESKKLLINQQKLSQLYENIEVLGWILPEYAELIEKSTEYGNSLRQIINDEDAVIEDESVDIFSRT